MDFSFDLLGFLLIVIAILFLKYIHKLIEYGFDKYKRYKNHERRKRRRK